MGDVTKIEWCHHTFNPWIGCSKVHTGCKHCYAEADMDTRSGMAEWGDAGNRVRTADTNWASPLKWNREAERAGERRRVFCASLADVFEDFDGPVARRVWNGRDQRFDFALLTERRRPHDRSVVTWPHGFTLNDLRHDLFHLIDATPWLDWMLLTKRPENIPRMWGAGWQVQRRENVWLGTSVSDQATADTMIPDLLECRELTPVLFVSAEPLIGPINFQISNLKSQTAIDMIIIGGESGPNARNCELAWIRSIVEQCRSADVSCFVKQLGAVSLWKYCEATGAVIRPQLSPERVVASLSDRKGGDPSEWPKDLRVRQFPLNQNGV